MSCRLLIDFAKHFLEFAKGLSVCFQRRFCRVYKTIPAEQIGSIELIQWESSRLKSRDIRSLSFHVVLLFGLFLWLVLCSRFLYEIYLNISYSELRAVNILFVSVYE